MVRSQTLFRLKSRARHKQALEPPRLPTADLVSWIAQSGDTMNNLGIIGKLRAGRAHQLSALDGEIAPNDPLRAHFLSVPGAVELEELNLDSPALNSLKAAGVKLTVPLISQGELVGLLNLGQHPSQHGYTLADRGLLNTLAAQATPAIRVAQLVEEQKQAIQEQERIQQEMTVARLVQQVLLPQEAPHLPGWQLAAYYQPARAVGGDFYDFIELDNGCLGLVVGDVTDKGVPAALVMASTRSILRAVAQGGAAPGVVLAHANELLLPAMPPKMFVTCFYAVLDPVSGRLHYANAGHVQPYQQGRYGVAELLATGMPLGLLPGVSYDEQETTLQPSERILFYSDGLVEAHNPQHELFGFPRLLALLETLTTSVDLIEALLHQLSGFTGAGREQEDDVTLVTLQRVAPRRESMALPNNHTMGGYHG